MEYDSEKRHQRGVATMQEPRKTAVPEIVVRTHCSEALRLQFCCTALTYKSRSVKTKSQKPVTFGPEGSRAGHARVKLRQFFCNSRRKSLIVILVVIEI